jgi:hypothetical protein
MLCDRVTQKNKKNLRFHRRTITRRYFTESWKKFTGVCHNHRRRPRRIITRWYFTESWKKFTRLCHNHRRNHLRCCRRILPTKSLTDYPHPEAHACQTRVHRHKYRRIFGRIEKSGGIFELFWCAYQLISDDITDGI